MSAALLLAVLFVADTGPVVVAGIATDSAGRPAASATVILAETVEWSVAWAPTGHAPRSTILHRTMTNDSGGFRLPLSKESRDRYTRSKPLTVWVRQDGSTLGVRSVPRDWPANGEPVRIKIAPPAAVPVRVVDPDGRPVVGAVVAPARVNGRWLPDDLGDNLKAAVDRDGRATLTAATAADLEVVRVTAPGYGIQQITLPPAGAGGLRTLHLTAAGRIEGRVTAADSAAGRGLTLYIGTRADPSDEAGTGGVTVVVTDADGRFVIPAIAAGQISIGFTCHTDLPYRGRFEGKPWVEAGATLRVEVPLKKAVQVRGEVKEVGTGKPIADVVVQIGFLPGEPTCRTDANGRYVGYLADSSISPYPMDAPPPFYFPQVFLDTQNIPPGATEFMVKPLEMARGETIRGRVVDDAGRPVAGAAVTGFWPMPARGFGAVNAWTDRDGWFHADSVDPKAEAELAADKEGLVTARTVRAKPGGEVTLTVSAKSAVAATGRIVGPDGQPVAGARVRVSSRWRGPENWSVTEGAVAFDGRETIAADADGRFRSPRTLRPDLDYRVDVDTPDFAPARTEWRPAGGKDLALADIVLAPLPRAVTVTGRVVDRDGKPVPLVTVSQSGDGPRPTRTQTDEQGRFRLPGVFAGPAVLFAEGRGFRFRGHPIEAGATPLTIVVDRPGDPLGIERRTLSPPISPERAKTLARQLLARQITSVLAGVLTGKVLADQSNYQLAMIVPRIDPAFTLDVLDRGWVTDESWTDYGRLNVAEGLLDDSPDEALALAETIRNMDQRATLYIKASDKLSAGAEDRKRELLHTALLYAHAATSSTRKLDAYGQIALRWLDRGETELATRILREGQAYARSLPAPTSANRRSDGPHARGQFAAKLARIDTAGALELAAGFTDEAYHDWYQGGVALGLAERDPAAAEEALNRVKSSYGRNDRLVRIASRVAKSDRAKARELADRIDDPPEKARALGAMAIALASSDPAAAEALLDEAFAASAGLARAGKFEGTTLSLAMTAASWLPAAERVGPECLDRCFWRVLALRPPRAARGDRIGRADMTAGQLAIMVARYDRDLARRLLEPTAGRLRALAADDRGQWSRPIVAAAAAIDPAWAIALVDALPDDPQSGHRPKETSRLVVADVLARVGSGFWEYVQLHYAFVRGDSREDER